MSSDKRRKARIQGGWASGASAQKNIRSDRSKAPIKPTPNWLARGSVDNPKSNGNANGNAPEAHQQYVYQEPTEEYRVKPEVRVINKDGVYDLSSTSQGVSRVRVFNKFLDPEQSQWMFEQLFQELPWKQKSDTREGKAYLQPRLTAWFGDLPYRYSGVIQAANPNWPPTLEIIKQKLEESTGFLYNSVLCNLYRDGHDSVDWHSDDEKSLGLDPTIASVSLGDTRNFELRKKPPPEENGDYTYMEHVRIPLVSGSLIIMEGTMQREWQHRVPKEYHDREARINLTFRMIYPE